MGEIFWFGQIFFIMFLVCVIYLAISYARLAYEESARTVKPDVPPAAQLSNESAGLMVFH